MNDRMDDRMEDGTEDTLLDDIVNAMQSVDIGAKPAVPHSYIAFGKCLDFHLVPRDTMHMRIISAKIVAWNAISELQDLVTLCIENTRVPSRAALAISRLPRIKRLYFSGTQDSADRILRIKDFEPLSDQCPTPDTEDGWIDFTRGVAPPNDASGLRPETPKLG